jgi:hypothetical protein
MTDLEEVPDEYAGLDDVPTNRWTDDERRAVTYQFIDEHLREIDRRVKAVRLLLSLTQ